MEKKINKKALIISLIFALVCCALIYSYLGNLEEPQQAKSLVKILVSSRNINAGEEIKAEDIHTIDISEDSVPMGIINDRENIEGFYAREPIIIGEYFRGERLAKREDLGLAFNIPDGMRALTVFVSENTIFSNQLKIGDRVDVIGNFTKEGEEGMESGNNTISKIIIQNIEILSIGSSRVNKDTGNAGTESSEILPGTVTLCVTPSDSEKMAYTTSFASYTFTLRGSGDDNNINTSGVMLKNLEE